MKSDFTASQVKALLALAVDARAEAETLYATQVERAIAIDTPLHELVDLKDTAKRLIREAGDREHREAAQLLYHAAVAAAFVRCDARISARPMQRQRGIYEAFARSLNGERIRTLFREAADRIAAETPRE